MIELETRVKIPFLWGKTVFKKSALEVAGAILNFLKEGISKGFIVDESQNI